MHLPFFLQIIPENPEEIVLDSIKNNMTKPLNFSAWNYQKIGSEWLEALCYFGLRVLLSIVIFFVGRWIIKRILRCLDNLWSKRSIEGLGASLFHAVIEAFLHIVLIIIIINLFGVTSTSLAAILASMGLAIGMALSGQLQNIAGGLIILVTKPFSISDIIEIDGEVGYVMDIRLFYTRLKTMDNKMIFIPNNILSSGRIINYTNLDYRRIEFIIGVEYGEDFDRVKKALLDLVSADPRVQKDPEPTVHLHALADSSVNVCLRIWAEGALYWDLYFYFNEKIYSEFNKFGIGFPFPQLTIHKA